MHVCLQMDIFVSVQGQSTFLSGITTTNLMASPRRPLPASTIATASIACCEVCDARELYLHVLVLALLCIMFVHVCMVSLSLQWCVDWRAYECNAKLRVFA